MRFTERTRAVMRREKFLRDIKKRGYEPLGENGNMIWELHRGGRQNHRITSCEIDPDGKSVWVKVEPFG